MCCVNTWRWGWEFTAPLSWSFLDFLRFPLFQGLPSDFSFSNSPILGMENIVFCLLDCTGVHTPHGHPYCSLAMHFCRHAYTWNQQRGVGSLVFPLSLLCFPLKWTLITVWGLGLHCWGGDKEGFHSSSFRVCLLCLIVSADRAEDNLCPFRITFSSWVSSTSSCSGQIPGKNYLRDEGFNFDPQFRKT